MTISSIISILAYALGGSLFVFLGITALVNTVPAYKKWVNGGKIRWMILSSIAFPSVLVLLIAGRGLFVVSSVIRALSHLMMGHPWTAIYELRDIKEWDTICGRDAF